MTSLPSYDSSRGTERVGVSQQGRHARRLLVVSTGALLVTIVLALSGAGLWIQPGSLLAPLESRTAYLASAPPGWMFAFLIWMVCALSLVAFLFAVANYTEHRYAGLALILGVVGAGVDILGQVVLATILPPLAAEMPASRATFLALEQLSMACSSIAGPMFYTLGIPLITKALPREARLTRAFGSVALASGIMMVAAGFSNDANFVAVTAPLQLLSYCVWAVLAVRVMLSGPVLQPASLAV